MTGSAVATSHPVCVIGGGLVGLVAAARLASIMPHSGRPIALVAPRREFEDTRTTAMLHPSIQILEQMGIWESIKPFAAALKTMRLIDGSKRLIRAPVTDFHASEIGLEAFGYNVPNTDLLNALENVIAQSGRVVRYEVSGEVETIDADMAHIRLNGGSHITSRLVVAADGRNSLARQAAGISVRRWSYPQTAIVLNFSHSLPHANISAEYHTETGPFTQVPLPAAPNNPHRSSLVWLVEPGRAEELCRIDPAELSLLVEERLQSSYGKCTVENRPVSIAMESMIAERFAANRTVLVGESAHVFPPIGAQGFNLGLRDVSELASQLQRQVDDPGDDRMTSDYDRHRAPDIRSRTVGVDFMNRSLLTGFLPVQLARNVGLTMMGTLSPIRKMAMWSGLGMHSRILSDLNIPERDNPQ